MSSYGDNVFRHKNWPDHEENPTSQYANNFARNLTSLGPGSPSAKPFCSVLSRASVYVLDMCREEPGESFATLQTESLDTEVTRAKAIAIQQVCLVFSLCLGHIHFYCFG